MMKLGTYAALSFLGATAAIYHAFSRREQFYPSMVYLTTSKICLVLVMNMALVIMCLLWQLVKLIFLGSLRESEVERLNEQSWREVMEVLFAITTFRQEFSVGFMGMVTALLLIKALHWMAQKRVEYIETTPTVSILSHLRIISFMAFLLILDCLFLYNSALPLIKIREASVALFFSFEYMILATTTVATFVKYTFYVCDMLMEGQWEKKAVYTFYLELIRDLLHLTLYLFFFTVIFMSSQVPLHLIRELYETFRNFRIRIADYLRYRRITSNMNERFPDATQEELNAPGVMRHALYAVRRWSRPRSWYAGTCFMFIACGHGWKGSIHVQLVGLLLLLITGRQEGSQRSLPKLQIIPGLGQDWRHPIGRIALRVLPKELLLSLKRSDYKLLLLLLRSTRSPSVIALRSCL
ncbi:ERAD-associated E3 ubiquitin-protein ligase HRD1-like isoform X2 [Wolffia australiana]